MLQKLIYSNLFYLQIFQNLNVYIFRTIFGRTCYGTTVACSCLFATNPSVNSTQKKLLWIMNIVFSIVVIVMMIVIQLDLQGVVFFY
jgi:hypothetical protein